VERKDIKNKEVEEKKEVVNEFGVGEIESEVN
jgi:hypothetical protein